MTDSNAFQLSDLEPTYLYAAEQDIWVRFEADGTATLGATHLIVLHGQFVFLRRGRWVRRSREIGRSA